MPELPEVVSSESTQEAPQEILPLDPEEVFREQMREIEPRISYHLHRYGLGDDMLARTQARVYAAQAVRTYDPASGAGLPTWLDRNMQQLSRFKRLRATAVHVPERMQMDAMTIQRAKTDFEETEGREPELEELADRAGMSIKRIDQVRKGFRKMTSEEGFGGELESAQQVDWMGEAVDMIWEESDKKDRQIIEMKTGYGGRHKPMTPKDIATKLQISPVDLSRRSTRIAAKLETIMEELER